MFIKIQNPKPRTKNHILKIKNFKKYFLVLILMLSFPSSIYALTISPPTKEFSVDPGRIINSQVLIKNDEKQNLQIKTTTQNFEAGGDKGEPRFISLAGDLSSWISFGDKQFTLAPGASKLISYSINIPADASPGGHFAGILFKATGAPSVIDGSSAQLENQIASLILLKVSGDVVESGRLKEFFVTLPWVDKITSFSNDDGELVKFSARFENLGNVFLKPYGAIRIKNWFGKQIAELGVNDLGGNVLPKSGRRFNVAWENNDAKAGVRRIFFGKYTASLEMFYGSENKKEIAELSFWLINRAGVIVFSGLVLVAAFIVWRIIVRMRKRGFFVERI